MKASFFERVLAWLIDRVFILILFLIASILILGPYSFAGPLGQAIGAMDSSKNVAIEFIRTAYNFYLFFLLLYLLSNRTYYFLFEVFSGQTIGKKILQLQVTDLNGNKPKFIKFFFRSTVYVVAYFLIYILSISIGNLQNWMYIIITNAVLYSTILFTPEKQTLYELLSSSKVLKEDKIVSEKPINTIGENNYSKIKKQKLIAPNINFKFLIISFVFTFISSNYILRCYVMRNFNSYEGIDLIDSLPFYLIFIIGFTLIIYNIIRLAFKKNILREKYYFPLNRGINRILFVVFIIISSFNEVLYLFRNDFEIRGHDFFDLLKIHISSYRDNFDRGQVNYNFNGLTIFLFFILCYLIFLWIYNGFKESKEIRSED